MFHEYPYSIKRHGTTLEKCEDEPVQTPGCIQAHGVLLVLRRSDLTILQISENSQDWLGFSPQDLLAKNVTIAVGEPVAQAIRTALDHERLDKVPLYLTTLRPRERENSRALHVSLHTHSGLAFLELEDATASDAELPNQLPWDPDYYGLVRKTLTRFQEASSIKALTQAVTEELRRITELDRVMVYYFHADDSGEVVAESKREDQDSWLGWRYPAHDIPRPAREIFKKIWSRPVPDVRAELFEMVPLLNPDTRKPLDMTYCSLRGASIMYTEYLENMRVRAALTLPLMREGELWGLIACHHDTPKLMSYRIRAAAEFLARGASQQLALAEEKENTGYRLSLEAANYALISKMALAQEMSAFTEGPVRLGSGLDCGGVAIFCQESWHTAGQTPSIQELTELGEWLLTQPECQDGSQTPLFVTDHLSAHYPAAKDFAVCASGLMAFCFSRNPLGLVLYFKPETLQTLTWAGNPNELPVLEGPHGPRLSPRKSFELWRETVTNRSMPWKRVEMEAVLKLRVLLIDLLVSKIEQIKVLQLQVAERTRELAASQARLQAELDAATQVLIIAGTPEGLITVFNPGAERMLGYTSEEMVGKQTPGIFHLESEVIARGLELTKEMGKPVYGLDVFTAKARIGQPEEQEWTYVRKDGSHLTASLVITASYDASGAIAGFVGIARDITERKQAEEKLHASEERFRLMVDSVKDYALFMLDPEGNVISWNAGAERIKGYQADEIIGRHFSCLYLPEAIATGHPAETLRLATLDGQHAEEGWRVRKDGSRFLADVVITAVRDDAGKLRGFAKVTRDITQRRQAEDLLKASARRLSLATQAMQAGVWEWDLKTNLTIGDEKINEIYGVSRDVVVDYQTWTRIVVPEDLPRAEAALQKVIASKSQGLTEFRITLPDGSIRYIEGAQGVILDDTGQVVRVVGVNLDVTERKRLEQQLLRAQRMETIGTLAGGIAHDLNNILAPIVMSIDLLKSMAEDPQTKSILDTIGLSANRGADIVRQVLSFARGMESKKIEVQPNHLLKELEIIIKDTFPKNIRLQFSIPKDTWTILGDPAQVHQVFLNLCLNARDAMPNGGSLTVSIENSVLSEQYGAMNLRAKAGRYVTISVSDTGTGIPPNLLDKIFEPFFTTKTLTQGTGLGLSTSLAIVRSHEGIIHVDSRPGEGAAFKVCLPAAERSIESHNEWPERAGFPRGNGEMILLIDDEASIRTVTGKILQIYGYQVLTASNGEDAVAIYSEQKNDIAVVLTDTNMPRMDGPTAIRALMKINPKIKIIATSGLNANESTAKAAGAGVKYFLTKPYTAGTLLQTMRAILDEG